MKSQVMQYDAAREDFRGTLNRLTLDIEALKPTDERADAITGLFIRLMELKIAALKPFLLPEHHERLEEIHMSLQDWDHESRYCGGVPMNRATLSAFLEKFREVAI